MNKLTKKARRNFDNCGELARCTRTWEKTAGGFSFLTSVKTSWPRATCTQTCEYMPSSSLFRLRTGTSSAEREDLQPETHSRRHPDTIPVLSYRQTNTWTYTLACIRIVCSHILTRTHEHNTLLDVHLYPHQHTDTGECTHTHTHNLRSDKGGLTALLSGTFPSTHQPPCPAVQPQRLSGSWQPKPAGLLCGWHFYFGTKCNLSQVIERSTAITTVYPYRRPLLTSSSWQ